MNQNNEPLLHKSVLVEEVIFYLNVKPHGIYVDATFGSGGHTRAILTKEPTAQVIGIDWDINSLTTYSSLIVQEFGEGRFIPVFGNFAHLYKLLRKISVDKVDGILADFGTSQMQIIERPGFSIYRDTPLDMRMSLSHQKIMAAQVVNTASAELLADIFYTYGEERLARKIAQAIVEQRTRKLFYTTKELADLVARIVPWPKHGKIHPATRVFQALRIYINQELENIKAFLKGAVGALAPQGRLVCISFHSLEDRLVKQFLREKADTGELKIVTKKVMGPTPEELQRNPSARSAKLRAAERIGS
jgi:16S rRNA (cytosine1402-N4)-methyltransferase